MTIAQPRTDPETAARILLSGCVQGVGLRPAISRLATELGLHGFVRNSADGVEILVEGDTDSVQRFEDRLRANDFGRIESVRSVDACVETFDSFTIEESQSSESLATEIPLDTGVCAECLSESLNPSDLRRPGYALTTCARCGPRYSIVKRMPFDRAQTSMTEFPLCSVCETEYHTDTDRRFHAQTTACPDCGPSLTFQCAGDEFSGEAAIKAAASVLREAGILAIKGVGGYQLVCDATSRQAVVRLRQLKQRPAKPFAVMVASTAEASWYAHLSNAAIRQLESPQNPIVLVPVKESAPSTAGEANEIATGLAPNVSPHLHQIGLMLPTTPLHALLLRALKRPCVVTSGNRSGEPLAYTNDTADHRLRSMVDGVVEHNRTIKRPVDDSVVIATEECPITIRAARGIAPLPLKIRSSHHILAVGGHKKVAIALANGAQSVMGPHLGNMDSIGLRQRFVDHVSDFTRLYQSRPEIRVHDLHPDYFSTRWAQEQTGQKIAVQHHHAHVVSGMVEHDWLNETVLGIAFDGTGYGPDGTIWGGEFLLCSSTEYRRVARFRPFPMIGGEQAIYEPWRIAMALLHDAGIGLDEVPSRRSRGTADLQPLTKHKHLFQWTSSVGRLFDGIASLILDIEEVSFEGEAAMRLEAVCDSSIVGEYSLPIESGAVLEVDWRPLLRQVVTDLNVGESPSTIATKFTRSLATACRDICRRFTDHNVVLSGGCFQNAFLLSQLRMTLSNHPEPVGFPGRIPPNDGGLAAGQLAVAVAQIDAAQKGIE